MNERKAGLISALALSLLTAASVAQSSQSTAPHGEVIFERHTAVPAADLTAPKQAEGKAPDADAAADISDTERSALTFTAYNLDARLTPGTSLLSMRARLTVRNDSKSPLTHIALQVSSSLRWESATLIAGSTLTRLPLAQHKLETDADHTGNASEAVLTLPNPLAPGASLTLDTFYSGAITQNSARLERIGATRTEAVKADWDAISSDATSLRGFGDVLWYPVAAPQLFLGQGAQLFEAIGQTKLRESTASVRLRLALEYTGDAPVAAYFCGHRRAFTAVSENNSAPIVNASGLATVEFPAAPLGFRIMSLFVIASRETPVASLPGASAAALLAVETPSESGQPDLPLIAATAKDAAALLTDWLGPQPLSTLAVLDHPGQPFEDGPFLVAPLSAIAAADALPALTHSLTHAWVQTGRPWMDEGLAQFFVLLGTERTRGREAAVAELTAMLQPVTLAEPAFEANQPAPGVSSVPTGQPLTTATSELYFRRKAAAVWWMLRDLAGEEPLKLTLQAWRTRPLSTATPDQDASDFEAMLAKNSGKDLHWFFDDWVLHDRGLPDLTLVDVTPRELPAAAGRSTGWLVAVTVRNEGAAGADVPVIIRSGNYSTTQRLRIPGFANASIRVVVEAQPTQVLLNDGSVPEQRTSLHTRDISIHTR